MKKILAALLLIFTLPAFAVSASPTLKDEQHKATYTIVTESLDSGQGAGCSATALSEHVLLTSAHCRVDNGVVYLNQTSRPFTHPLKVSDRFYDGADHMLLVLPGVTFKHFIAYDPDDYKPAMVGDRYYLWGNPSLIADQYREGYISGTLIPPNNEGVMLSPKIMLISGPVVGGDSGSAIFAEDGRVVGTLTWGIDGGLFGGFYPLAFTKQQVLQAEGLGTFTYGPEEVKPIPPIPPAVTVNVPPVDNSPLYLIAVILLFPLIMKIFTLLRFVKRPAAYLWRLMKFIRAGFKSAVRVAREI